MKISCPACAAKYSIADEKVQERLAKIRCRKCGTTIVIDGKVHPPHIYAADASAGDHPHVSGHSMGEGSAAQEYSVDFGDNDQRTLPLKEIISAYNSGQVTAETYVWAEGMSDWKPLGEVPEIVQALHSAASRPSVRPSAAAATPAASPWEAPGRPSDAAVARVAAKSGGRGGAGDLFGGFGSAGSEEDVTTSAPEGQLQQMAAATGARNESSVLFSLSALTAAAKSTASAPLPTSPSLAAVSSPAKKNHEDSGLIDLKALTASSPRTDDVAPIGVLGAPPLGMTAPLGYGAPLGGGLGAGVDAQITYPERRNRTGIFITAGIVIVAVAVAGMFILRPAPPPPPAAPPVAAMTVPPAPTPTPDPVTAQPPATGTADPSASASAAPQKQAGRYRPRGGGGGAKKSSGAAAPESGGGESAPKKAPVQRGGCGCAPSDLVCNMKCAAKGG